MQTREERARCQIPRCRRESAIDYLGHDVCDPCWIRYLAEDAPEGALRKKLGIPLDNPIIPGKMDSHHDESGATPKEEPMAKKDGKKKARRVHVKPEGNGAERVTRAKPAKIEVGQKFVAIYKGQPYNATVISKEGGGVQIRANGNSVYPSLTAAANAILEIDTSKPGRRVSGRTFFRPADEEPKPKRVRKMKAAAPTAEPSSDAATA